jgi:hypothetical protein
MKHQVRKGHAPQGDAEFGHVREVGLRHLPRLVHLRKEHFPVRPVLRSPAGDMGLQRAQLPVLKDTGVLRLQQRKQGGGLQGRVSLQLRDHPRPHVGKRIGARAVGTGPLALAGQPALPLIGAHGAHTHASTGGGLGLGAPFGPFSEHHQDLLVSFHGALLRLECHDDSALPSRAATGNFNLRHR